MTTIPISKLTIPARLRSTFDDSVDRHIEDLAASITRFGGFPHGLLQLPIIDDDYTLQDGWCRVQACKRLGWTEIPVHIRSRLSDYDYQEIELETNFNRLDFTWQEVVRGVVRIHKSRRGLSLAEGKDWSREMTGELIGYSKQYIDNCFNVNMMLSSPEGFELLKPCNSITDAVRVYLREEEAKLVREQARRTVLKPVAVPDFLRVLDEDIDLTEIRSVPDNAEQVIDLSNTCFCGDSIRDILPKWPEESVNHIICDPPYGIDVEMLQQATTALMDVSRVADAHTVEENLALFKLMYPAFYRILKPGGFCCCCCDIMNWQYLYDEATAAGFRVQRWPIVWHKTSQCKNQFAAKNTTKDMEFVIVASKQGVIPKPVMTSIITCANDDMKESNPFAKPFDFWRMLYEWFTSEGQTVLEPFAGEGSSVISGYRLNRRVLAIEREQHHFDYLLKNLKQHWSRVFNEKVKFI